MSDDFSTQTGEREATGIVLGTPQGKTTADLVALNAAPAVKAAKNLDGFGFALRDMRKHGYVTGSETPVDGGPTVGEAMRTLVKFIGSLSPMRTTVPVKADASAVKALETLLQGAATNEHSSLMRHAAAVTVVEVAKK